MRRRATQAAALALWLAAAANGQDPGAAAHAAMEAAIARQLESVAVQESTAAALADSVARQREAVRVQESVAGPWPWPDRPEIRQGEPPSCVRLPETGTEAPPGTAGAAAGSAPGLIRLIPAAAAELPMAGIFDPVESAHWRARFLARLLAWGGL